MKLIITGFGAPGHASEIPCASAAAQNEGVALASYSGAPCVGAAPCTSADGSAPTNHRRAIPSVLEGVGLDIFGAALDNTDS